MIDRIVIELTPNVGLGGDIVSLRVAVKLGGDSKVSQIDKFIRFDELEPMIDVYMEQATLELKEYLRLHRTQNERRSAAEVEFAITKLLNEKGRI